MKPISNKQIRLPGFDYSTFGAYFITICVNDQPIPLSHCIGERTSLTPLGKIVQEEWLATGEKNPDVELDDFVVMPDHFHSIIWLRNPLDAVPMLNYERTPQTPGYTSTFGGKIARLSHLIKYFKGMAKRKANLHGYPSFKWQRRFHDRIIRNEKELHHIRYYIQQNPIRW